MNELTARTNPSTSLTYDDAGNLTQDGDSDGDHKFSWDYRNRLIEVEERQSGNWNTVAEYRYDASNRRILKTVTNKGDLNGTTRFLWGGQSNWQCLEERDSGGDLVARYTYATTYIDAVAVQERDLNGDDDFADDDEVVCYHSNTLYSVYALSDDGENVVERMRYDAYGAATVLDSDFSSDADGASDVENPYRFTARRVDAETALMQYRNRHYDPGLGRFISRDSIGYTASFDLYIYVANAPTALADPLGLTMIYPEDPWGQLLEDLDRCTHIPGSLSNLSFSPYASPATLRPLPPPSAPSPPSRGGRDEGGGREGGEGHAGDAEEECKGGHWTCPKWEFSGNPPSGKDRKVISKPLFWCFYMECIWHRWCTKVTKWGTKTKKQIYSREKRIAPHTCIIREIPAALPLPGSNALDASRAIDGRWAGDPPNRNKCYRIKPSRYYPAPED